MVYGEDETRKEKKRKEKRGRKGMNGNGAQIVKGENLG